MKKLSLITMVVGLALGQSALATVKGYDFQCRATGHQLRQQGGSGQEHKVESRFIFELEVRENDPNLPDRTWLRSALGNIGIAAYEPGVDPLPESVNYWGSYHYEKKLASLSPRARKYTDAKYFRFRDFDATRTARFDGGGMWGYLVISKNVVELKKLREESERRKPFDAHYVFSAGDHMGGSLDLECKLEH